MIEIKNLSKQFEEKKDSFYALRAVNLIINEKEFVTVVGHSGCGKTTLLRLIAGLEEPTEGKIYFDGQDVTSLLPQKRRIGMVFQNYALFPHMTVRKNIEFGLEEMKLTESQIKKKAEASAERVHLDHKLDVKIPFLSGGEQQRVAVARAIVTEPSVLLFDEPLSNLDPLLREELRKEIIRVQRETNITSIYVTHDQSEALSLADRVIVMNTGHIEQYATPKEIYFSPASPFVASFIGTAQLLNGEIVSHLDTECTIRITENCVLTVAQKDGERFQPGENVILAVKPEAVLFSSDGAKAVITEKIFYGNVTEYSLNSNGFHLRARVTQPRSNALQVGDTTTFQLDSGLCSIFRNVSV